MENEEKVDEVEGEVEKVDGQPVHAPFAASNPPPQSP
jgi:hypothetical protein